MEKAVVLKLKLDLADIKARAKLLGNEYEDQLSDSTADATMIIEKFLDRLMFPTYVEGIEFAEIIEEYEQWERRTFVNCPRKECKHNSGAGKCKRKDITLSTAGILPVKLHCLDFEVRTQTV